MEIHRCIHCMHELKPGETVCPECGHVYGSWATDPIALKPGTILDGKYLVGEMLGQGGFGITYIGFDLLLEQKVAIKEYFPISTGLVSRDNQTAVVWNSTRMEKAGVQKGFDSFLKEARKMAKLKNIPNVVGVNSVFIQNETAYIVMDFVEGETLLKKLQQEGPMEFDTCISLLKPIMQALAEVHQHGIIHRDISPDNIMVQTDGTLILLDLGAAKDLDIQKADGTVQSSQLVAKQGFSPVEQYGRSEKIGPWTDVYAMAATIYYCCTGKLPPSATDRVVDDTLSCQPLLTKVQFDALSTCMTILPEKRPQDMDAMLEIITHAAELQGTEQVKLEPTEPKPPKTEPANSEPPTTNPPEDTQTPKRKPSLFKWLIPVAAVGVAVLAIIIGIGKKPDTTPAEKNIAVQTASTEAVPLEVHVMAMAENLSGIDNAVRGDRPFWGQSTYKRKDVETITFQNSLTNVPNNAWDISKAKNKTVLAWMDGSALYVAADGKIAPNPNASWMFANFVNLTEIDFGSCFDTSNVFNMNAMFSGCNKLTELDTSCFDTKKVTDMGGMFNYCHSLTKLDVSGFDTTNVTYMGWMFSECSSLTNLDVSGFDTANVTSVSAMFQSCSSLTKLDLSGFDTSNVTDMGYMFWGCESLTELNVSGFDTANVTTMDSMFSNCSSLTSLNLSSFDTTNVRDMHNMFSGCNKLLSLDLSGLDTSNVRDMRDMFSGCSSLPNLDLSAFNTANVRDIGSMFSGCSSLASLDLSGFNTAGMWEMNQMFKGCSSLTSLDLSSFRTANVRNMYEMFSGCSNLTSLNLSGFTTASVNVMGSMFSECRSLTDLKCSDSKIFEEYEKIFPAAVPPSGTEGTELKLKNADILTAKGYIFTLELDCALKPEDIEWTTRDANVATVKNGVVTTVGSGTTVITAKYGNQTAECIIRCN